VLLLYLQPVRKEMNVFPTTYELNTKRALRRYFPGHGYQHYSYDHTLERACYPKFILPGLWSC
jgi:hypothetical protein